MGKKRERRLFSGARAASDVINVSVPWGSPGAPDPGVSRKAPGGALPALGRGSRSSALPAHTPGPRPLPGTADPSRHRVLPRSAHSGTLRASR